MIAPYIPKEDPEIPDFYTVKVFYHDGSSEEFSGHHIFVKETQSYDFVTKEDEWYNIPLTSIRKLKFDKNFSKLIAIKQKNS